MHTYIYYTRTKMKYNSFYSFCSSSFTISISGVVSVALPPLLSLLLLLLVVAELLTLLSTGPMGPSFVIKSAGFPSPADDFKEISEKENVNIRIELEDNNQLKLSKHDTPKLSKELHNLISETKNIENFEGMLLE